MGNKGRSGVSARYMVTQAKVVSVIKWSEEMQHQLSQHVAGDPRSFFSNANGRTRLHRSIIDLFFSHSHGLRATTKIRNIGLWGFQHLSVTGPARGVLCNTPCDWMLVCLMSCFEHTQTSVSSTEPSKDNRKRVQHKMYIKGKWPTLSHLPMGCICYAMPIS